MVVNKNNEEIKEVHNKEKTPQKIIKNNKKHEEDRNISIFIGTGLYLIICGLCFALLVSFLIGLPIIMAYPYIHPITLWILKIFGWILIFFGVLTCLAPYIKDKKGELKIINIFLRISVILTLILVPIGIILGFGLKSELLSREIEHQTEEKEKKNRFEMFKVDWNPIAKSYFYLLFIVGLIHVVIGLLILFVLLPALASLLSLVYPILTQETLNFLTISAWICIIPGAILLICSFWSKKLSIIENFEDEKIGIKTIRVFILISSLILIFFFPIGTFFGFTLLQEFYSLRYLEDNKD